MTASTFDPGSYERGRKYSLDLEVPNHPEITIPVLLIRGANSGAMLVVSAAVHGDEFEGVRAIFEVVEQIDPSEMSGDLLAAPVSNPPAFWAGTRCSPLDGANLARVFPGSPDGGPTPAIAHTLAEALISKADFYLDLHSAGVACLMPTMAGYSANDPRGRDAAECFGATVIWGHPDIAPGRTISFAHERRIPWLYSEARGAGRIDPEDLRTFRQGVLNLMRHLNILPGEAVIQTPIRHRLLGDGNIEAGLTCGVEGFFMSAVELLQPVAKGQELGRTVDLHGETIETFCATDAGIVALIRQFPVVKPGDAMFVVTGTEET
ncbi:MAG: M14 family metallopeptidase [Acidobacteria bacterium]|nr:M14 family metallopeptidase [Acidobacteriota bacterium]